MHKRVTLDKRIRTAATNLIIAVKAAPDVRHRVRKPLRTTPFCSRHVDRLVRHGANIALAEVLAFRQLDVAGSLVPGGDEGLVRRNIATTIPARCRFTEDVVDHLQTVQNTHKGGKDA